MVRRLKRDIKTIELTDEYPDRHVVQIGLSRTDAGCRQGLTSGPRPTARGRASTPRRPWPEAAPPTSRLSELLRQYAARSREVKGRAAASRW
jgi:hypothetical protein